MRLLLFLFFLLPFMSTYSQKKHTQVFTHFANTQLYGVKEKFTLYYIIDSNIVYKKGNLIYYGFNFSMDSSSYTGLITYDKKAGNILYLSDTSGKIGAQKIFSLKNSVNNKISFFPFLGINIIMKRRVISNMVSFHPIYLFPNNSHTVIIKNFNFKKGEIYPTSIVFYFPFDDNTNTEIFSTSTF